MNLMIIILLFFPAFFSVNLDGKFNGNDLINNKYMFIKKYVYYTFFILIINFLIIYISVGSEATWYFSVSNVDFVLKYLVLSFCISCILPLISIFYKNNFEIKLKLKGNKK